MAQIKEINKTLIIEKFTDKNFVNIANKEHRMSLADALNDAYDDENQDFNYRDVDITALQVRSFDEFLERFAPDLFMTVKNDGNGDYFVYSTDPGEYPGAKPVKFDKTAFYRSAIDLYNSKGGSGKSNYEFDYSDFSRLLSPQESAKKIKKDRRSLEFNVRKALEAKSSGNTAEEKNFKKKALKIVEDVLEANQDFITFLSMRIADAESKLMLDMSDDKGKSPAAIPERDPSEYMLEFNSEGELVKKRIDTITPNGAAANSNNRLIENTASQIAQLMDKTFPTTDNTSENDAYKNQIIKSVYTGTGIITTSDLKEIKKQYDRDVEVYKAAQDSLLKSICRIIEKFLDVKALFDNAGGKAELLIANCTVNDIIDDQQTLDNFRKFMVDTNSNCDKIWFAVLPQIDDPELVDRINSGQVYIPQLKESGTEEPDIIDVDYSSADDDENSELSGAWDNLWDDDDEISEKCDLPSLQQAKKIMDILAEAKCTTFFGYKGCEKTGFSKMTLSCLEKYKEKLNVINSPYCIFAYPNFTLISGKLAGNITIAADQMIENPGMYIDAPYIAAGITIRYLKTDELEKAGFKVNRKDLPSVCVRFDFEDPANDYECRNKITTNMNCEESQKYPKSLSDAQDKEPFGFFFDPVGYYRGKRVANTIVRYARNMSDGDNRIFTTLVKDFIWTEITNGDRSVFPETIEYYKENNKWKRDGINSYINCPLRPGEDFDIEEIDGKKIAYVKFNGCDTNNKIDQMEINTNNGEDKK